MISLFLLLLLFGAQISLAQNQPISHSSYIKKLIENDSLKKAQQELAKQLDYYKNQKNIDSLINYVLLVGNIKLVEDNQDLALKKTANFVNHIKSFNSAFHSKEALADLASLYSDFGNYKASYDILKEALELAKTISDEKKSGQENILYSMGINARNFGDFALSKQLLSDALQIRNNSKNKDYESEYLIYNAMGGVMWYSTKLDSAMVYFKEALKSLKLMDSTPYNRFYRTGIVRGNVAVLEQATGNIGQAIKTTEQVINDYQNFINLSKDDSQKAKALKFQLLNIDNLGSFYHSIGEFNRANNLIQYAYDQKLTHFKDDKRGILISLIILSQAKIGLRDFESAGTLLDEALTLIEENPSIDMYWQAAATITRAMVYDELGQVNKAQELYKKSEAQYRNSLKGDYTRDFLDELIEMSLFYSKTGSEDKALALAQESYDYATSAQFKSNLQKFHHILNLAEVYYNLKDYNQAITYSSEALNLFSGKDFKTSNTQDSILLQYRKPKALLINAQSKYNTNTDKSEPFLKDLLQQIETGKAILDQRKSIIKSFDDLNLLITENDELFDFSKKLYLELYKKTKSETYLNQIITTHESSMYNRIRARLNLKNDLAFANIPKTIVDREQNLKNRLNMALETDSETQLNDFFQINNEWHVFQDSLKNHYPKYYSMRYASIEESLDNLQNQIPDKTTVVRYLFIENQLYAFVVTNINTNFRQLDTENLTSQIQFLGEDQSDFSKNSSAYFELYQQLWQPIVEFVRTKKVIIIPDDELFNLSFETLTPTQIKTFEDLKANSLLAKHNISYNFSLLLLNKAQKPSFYSDNFIGFAPQFSDEMKQDYLLAISDSLSLDKSYMTLLPQPFSATLTNDYSKIFKGSSFLNEQATKTLFSKQAKEHKIIHIGTHAESNNISPELSRLIFAKTNESMDNSLFTYEIYNLNLNSNLAILTACETGKPTYQSGEGMISLAHAFNYAGSESMLTSLWKIDEQSSNQILKLFYNNLSDGMSKDQALRQAKLDYIASAKGRTIAPQYWAGLVLIGDASPIDLNSSSNSLMFWLIGLGILILLVLLYMTKLHKSQ